MDTPTLFPVIYNEPKKQQAYTLIVYRGASFREASKVTGIAQDQIEAWFDQDDWKIKREDHLASARQAAAASVGMQVSARARKMTAKVLSIHEKLLESLENAADSATSPKEMADTAKTLASLYTIYSGMLNVGGVTEKAPEIVAPGAAPAAPATLVQVNVLANLVKAGEAKAGFGVQVNGEEVDATQVRG